jgi:flagellar biosynthesis protein FlhB
VNPLHASLDYHLERQNVLASNIAHVDTPGFHPKDLERVEGAAFQQVMGVTMGRTNAAHIASEAGTAVDYLKSYFSHRKKMMMSRQEMKDEMKQSEGDPAMKGRQRARAREMLRKGLAKQVKRADVIVANPTHVSVALRYRAQEGAPVVTCKGVDEVALYIRELAKKNDIPIVTNIKLARALNAQVKAGKAIPVELYKAAAEVLAFVYRLKSKGVRA